VAALFGCHQDLAAALGLAGRLPWQPPLEAERVGGSL
jgi:hypothetical protein